jgi:anti-sigma-K factor RskA
VGWTSCDERWRCEISHVDPETLALLALGEYVGDEDADHLQSCPECRAEIVSLREVVQVGRAAAPLRGTLPEPPPHLWERIREGIASGERAGPAAGSSGASLRSVGPSASPGTDHQAATKGPRMRRRGVAEDARPREPGPRSGAPPARPGTRRRQARAALASALALAALAVIGAIVLPGRVTLQATAALEPLEAGRPGTAQLVEDRSGQALRIADGSLSGVEGAYYEVWLADPNVERLISLGPYVPGQPNRLPLGLDVESFPVVDVSVEPVDGDPSHSGRSILRGTLPTA